MRKKIKEVDRWLDKVVPILLLVSLGIILRIPSLFEPYWYGDEAIYLTIGNALKHGGILYRDIVDHKTPLIYYFAMVPSQIWFKFLNITWMSGATVLFYELARRIIRNKSITYFTTFIFVLLTSLPALEGNIPNGELFVMGFILAGGLLFFDNYFKEFAQEKGKIAGKWYLYFLGGILMGLGVLTKVPAIFDVAAFLSLAWFLYFDKLVELKKISIKNVINLLISLTSKLLFTVGGMLAVISLSVIYFLARGAGSEYLDFGLLYNFRYVQNWQLPFEAPILLELFTLRAKVIIGAGLILLMTKWGKKVSLQFRFTASWLILAVIASTLSNRPYPHYYLQVVPPATLVFGLILNNLRKVTSKRKELEIGFGVFLLVLMIQVFVMLKIGFYPTISYYQNFIKYASGRIGREEYYSSFDQITRDNYKATAIIQKSDYPYLFIWGTNPVLYAQTKKVPTGRFTVSFHIKDFNAYEATLNDFINKKPMFAVVMNNEVELEGLNAYLSANYIPNYNFNSFVLWKRMYNNYTK